MQIYSKSGVTESDNLRVSKSFGALLISANLPFSALANEKITIFIEKANGTNIDIAKDEILKDYIKLGTYGDSIINGTATSFVATVPLGDGSIVLDDNDSIKIKLNVLDSVKTYSLNTIEMPMQSDYVISVDNKVFMNDEKNRVFDTSHTNMIYFDNIAPLREVVLNYNNGQSNKHTVAELQSISQDVDNLQEIKDGLAIVQDANTLVFPLFGVVSIELTKISGVVNMKTKKFLNY